MMLLWTLAAFMYWTLLVYWLHRLVHVLGWQAHIDHHHQVDASAVGFHWTNMFLFFDSWRSTLDQWFTEVGPVLLVSWLWGTWVLAFAYYVWAAFIQEHVEHDPKFDWYPWLTSGRWHLKHHKYPGCNFGVFHPLWDKLFGTAF